MEARNQNYIHKEVTSRLIWVVFATSQFIFYYMIYDIWYDMIFIYCNWVSTWWQWSVDCIQTG